MKFSTFIIFTLFILNICVLLVNSKLTGTKKEANKVVAKSKKNKKQVDIITDKSGFGTDIGVVIRKFPGIWAHNTSGEELLEPPQSHVWFSNSNTSNGPNVGTMGVSPEIVNNQIILHDREPVTLVKETPAQLGYRNEVKKVTVLNKATGRTESHDLHQKTPIYGNVESIKTVSADTVKSYDMDFRRMRKPYTRIQENPEFTFQPAFKFQHDQH